MKPFIKKSFVHAALAIGLFGSPLAATAAGLLASTAAHAEAAPTLEEMKKTLAQYGEFVTHAKYGEVWKPTVTPRGWHPYPACDWVYTKDLGWYFNDKTPWGAIVHHYGRWTHDEAEGWLWTPGAEFSPGWVVWRTSAEWIGWAPTPPDMDVTPVAMEKFDDDKLWTFMDAAKFGNDCTGVATASQTPAIYRDTTYVTRMTFVNGVGVFVLPVAGPVIDVNIGVFGPWSTSFIGSWVWNWTSIFNDVDINVVLVNNCGPEKRPNEPGRPGLTHITAPPPPPARGEQPRRLRDNPGPSIQRYAPPRRTQIRQFDPAPDDVIEVGPRRPGRQFEPRRPWRQVERDPGRDVQARDPGKREQRRRPDHDFDRGFDGRRGGGDREAGQRQPSPERFKRLGAGSRSFEGRGRDGGDGGRGGQRQAFEIR